MLNAEMNQQCKVCGEPAAGFHFGAFTCEGCKSFFGRSYNNLNSISECKNNGECIINKKNRTACKACRLRKCLVVGMSKSGSRYGRRSNWFKIHCLLQEQQHQHQQQASGLQQNLKQEQRTPPPHHHQTLGLGLLGAQPFASPLLHLPKTKEELILLGLDEYKHTPSPSVSSPESHNSDSSVEINDVRRFPLFPRLLPPTFLPPPSLFLTPAYSPFYQNMLHSVNNNNGLMRNHNATPETETKVTLLDAILKSHRRTPPEEVETAMSSESSIQQDPIDLSMKTMSERGSSPAQSEKTSSDTTERDAGSEADEESDCDSERELKRIKLPTRPGPLDLTTRV